MDPNVFPIEVYIRVVRAALGADVQLARALSEFVPEALHAEVKRTLFDLPRECPDHPGKPWYHCY